MTKCVLRVVLTLLAFVTLGSSSAQARALPLDERVAAQEAIERVYYSHQVGSVKPFEEAVPRGLLQRKVVRYLKQSKALEQVWHTPVTAEMLEHELQRMIAGSQMPGRLQELFAALDHDSFLIQECLARATLVDRLTRSFQASEETPWEIWWNTASLQLDESEVATVADPGVPVHLGTLDGICATDETWDNGVLDDAPLPLYEHTAVWTGSRMLIWGGCERAYCGGGRLTRNGYQYDPATDSWTPISTTGAPSARFEHSAIWTGSRMVIWGGDDDRFLDTGGRYDPLTDSWTATTTVGVPSPRFGHTAVWTGSEMLIWGGEHNQPDPYAGGRYDPVADTWVLISTVNAPSRRKHHSAVWTGSEMIVWGAAADLSGGVYTPATDSWLLTSPIGAPSVRSGHTAIWTGDRMLIWGGSYDSTGGLYDPVTEIWTPTSTVDAPLPRWNHTGVWTGSEMLVWGGWNDSQMHDTGGRYDPVADSWTPITTAGAPSPRVAHAAVWTGSLMVVWGGIDCRNDPWCSYFNTGGRYDPVSDSWTPTSTTGAPTRRYGHSAVWTGSQMIVWGGQILGAWDDYDVHRDTGGRYDPATDSWTPTSIVDAPSPRTWHTAIWTGNRMVIWGGGNGWVAFDTGGRYDPVADQWTPTSTENAPYEAWKHTALWTGSLMLTWTPEHGTYEYSGGRYDPDNDTWTRMTNEGEPPSRDGHAAVWTGEEMIVWGGHSGLDPLAGGRYDPELDRWAPVSTVGAPSSRDEHTAVWTGDVMVVWGGDADWDYTHIPLNDGGKYDPETDSWTEIDSWQVASPRYGHTAVWTGSEMLVWGGRDNDGNLNTGAWFELFWEHWWPFSTVDAPLPRQEHTAVWSGSHMIVWGGLNHYELDNGGRYAMGHTRDDDGDGLDECDGDCNDDNPWIYPDALEVCDGYDNQCPGDAGHGVIDLNCNKDGDDFCDAAMVSVGFPAVCVGGGGDCDDDDPLLFPNSPEWNDGIDNQCPGDPGYGVIDETSGNCGFNDPNDKSEYSWPAQPGAVEYEVVRSGRPDFYSGCTFLTTTETAIVALDPEVGETQFYLTRPVAPLVGSWGQDSLLRERFPVCSSGPAMINFQPLARSRASLILAMNAETESSDN